MDESSEISKKFYKIGKVETPIRISGLDPEWKAFGSLGQAMDYRVGLIAGHDRFTDLGSAKTFQDTSFALPVILACPESVLKEILESPPAGGSPE